MIIKPVKTQLIFIPLLFIIISVQVLAVETFKLKSSQFQKQNIIHNTIKKRSYYYVAKTSKKVRKQGKVNASGIKWICKKNRCTTKGPWTKPSVTACKSLAKQVGPIRSFGRSGHYLSKKYLRQCNQKISSSRKKKKYIKYRAKRNYLKQKNISRLNKQKAKQFFNRLPLDPAIKAKLSHLRDVRYLVMTNALSGRSHRIERRIWTGKILLPDLRKKGKVVPIRFTRKASKGIPSRTKTAWFIKNPDGSLSRQILNSQGRLAGNITFTKDGSVRIGFDLNGDQVADLYETIISSGEHSLLASPAGQAALNHFRNGGKNPLCNSGAAGSKSGDTFAIGMISGSDKTAMQVVCGQKPHKPANGGSASSGGGKISGNLAGRATDAMCKGVLSQHRGQPGNPGMTMGDPVGSDDDPRQFHWGRAFVEIGKSLLGVAATIGDALSAGGGHYVNDADEALRSFESTHSYNEFQGHDSSNEQPDGEIVRTACAAGSTSQYCGSWLDNYNRNNPESGSNSGGNSSRPGPDQQTDPDAAMLSFCQNRAKNKAWWASITKDTRYVKQLCDNPASQPNPAGKRSAGKTSSATLGGSYGSSVTLNTYCGQNGGQKTPSPSNRLAGQTGSGSNCGKTESPGTDGKCRSGTQFNGGSAGKVNVSYGSVIGIPLSDPQRTNPAPRY